MELGLEMEHPKCTAGGSPRASPGGGHVLVNLSLFYNSTDPQYSSTLLQIHSTILHFYSSQSAGDFYRPVTCKAA